MGTYKIKSWIVRSAGEFFTLPCLGGESHARHRSDIVVTVNNGAICDEYNSPYPIADTGRGISGWGFLDSTDSLLIGSNVLIPKELIDGLIAMVGRSDGR